MRRPRGRHKRLGDRTRSVRLGDYESALMVDDKSNRGPADATRVNVSQPHELRYWCEKFSCTPTELRMAVRAVGVMARAVEAHLKQT